MLDWISSRTTLHERLRSLPDHADTGPWDTAIPEIEDVTFAATPNGLRKLADALNARCQGDISVAYIEEQIAHEDEHATAARAVGFTAISYGLFEHAEVTSRNGDSFTVATRWQMTIAHQAPAGPVSKLAYASVVATPARLSAGDLEALRDMGYRDAADVARRIDNYRHRTGIVLPVPAGTH
jgi:hypothetical protein